MRFQGDKENNGQASSQNSWSVCAWEVRDRLLIRSSAEKGGGVLPASLPSSLPRPLAPSHSFPCAGGPLAEALASRTCENSPLP